MLILLSTKWPGVSDGATSQVHCDYSGDLGPGMHGY